MTKPNLFHEHLAKGSTHAPPTKPDLIHLYLNKIVYGGLNIVNH